MNKQLKYNLFPGSIVILSFLFGIFFFNSFPEQVATHWNFEGKPDGYSGKIFGAFFIPVLLLFFHLLFYFLPKFDPKKANYELFLGTYTGIRNIFLILLFAIFLGTSFVNLGFDLPINIFVPLLVGAAFIWLGKIIKNVKQNWFVGFRFPWTLSNEAVWTKTQHVGGNCMMMAGVLVGASPFFSPKIGLAIFIAAVLQMIFIPMVFSYRYFKKLTTVEKSPPA